MRQILFYLIRFELKCLFPHSFFGHILRHIWNLCFQLCLLECNHPPPWLTTSDIRVSIDPTIPPFFTYWLWFLIGRLLSQFSRTYHPPPLSLVGIKVAPFGTPTHSSGGPTPCALCPLLHAAQISEAWNNGL